MNILLLASETAEGAAQSPLDMKLLPAISTVVVFLVALGIFAFVVWPKITKALDARDEKILGEIRAAEAAQAKAKAAQGEFEKKLEEARAAADDMIRKARGEADRQAEELRSRSQRELDEMRQRATQELESAKRTALAEIHATAATLATAVAGKILKREIQPGDQKRLVDESLAEMTSR
ncbi:MAG: F0F1 ATP synthase subunit B [Planctomycetes bacterium]|nr:F0F1 ATP synthase subunit B [Planctomycetota bacterium]